MLFVRPDFYDEFHCLASACRHSCCVGWEIDVDEESLRRYQGTGGEIGRALRENIALEPTPHFRLASGERCPFLREDGLCRLILALGEDSLCDICALHPRFFNDYPDREEAGLGLCCEEAARLLTAGEGHLRLVAWSDGEEEPEPTPLLRLRAFSSRSSAWTRPGRRCSIRLPPQRSGSRRSAPRAMPGSRSTWCTATLPLPRARRTRRRACSSAFTPCASSRRWRLTAPTPCAFSPRRSNTPTRMWRKSAGGFPEGKSGDDFLIEERPGL